jgi:hypothetical protein
MMRLFGRLFNIAKTIQNGKEYAPYEDGLFNPYVRVFNYWQDKLVVVEEELTFEEADKVVDALNVIYNDFKERDSEFKETVVFCYDNRTLEEH